MRIKNHLFILCFATLSGCATVDFDTPREASFAMDASESTTLKQKIEKWKEINPGPSGFYPLVDGTDALGARLRLIEAAEKTIDAQYFLMKNDSAGQVFASALFAAADRGVRVRFLLDDIFTTVGDEAMTIIDGHPNIELRLYNPVSRTGIKGLNYLGDFSRANRRMHNKSFIVDNAAAVVGGRNIADEYFNLNQEGEFLDFDMLIFGEVSEALSVEFDRYWNHERSVPAEVVVGRISEQELADFRNNLSREKLESARKHYQEAFDSDLMLSIGQQETRFYSADAIVITDDPDKLVTAIDVENRLLVKALAEIVNEVTSEVVVMTPYFIPGKAGVDFWRSIVARGVRVVIVTNSLAANNHTAVHSGYARYRKDIIRAGVELFEARADAVAAADKTMTMHTKAMIFDRESVFVGSLNLDPRSIAINSEMGVVVSSPEMTESLSTRLFSNLPQWTYRVTLNEQGKLRWHANIDGEEVVGTKEPLASWWRRFSAWFLRIAPENQL